MSKKEILICEGKHCCKKSKGIAEKLDSKEIRIKTAKCLDMCDNAQVAYIKEGHGIYLKSVHKYDKSQWKELLKALEEGKNIKKLDFVKTI
jgi:hypothetical protein